MIKSLRVHDYRIMHPGSEVFAILPYYQIIYSGV